MISEYFYRAMALMLTVGALSKIQKIERKDQARSEKFAKMLEIDDKSKCFLLSYPLLLLYNDV